MKLKKIANKWNGFASKNKQLVFVFDYDRDTRKDKQLNQNIISYCQSFVIPNEIIWFKKDIENIFIGHTVKDKDKNSTAIEFYNKGTLEKTKEKILSLTKHTIFKSSSESNVLSILSNHLKVTTSLSQTIKECIQKILRKKTKLKQNRLERKFPH